MKKKLYILSIVFVIVGILAFVYRMAQPEQITADGMFIDHLGWIVGGYLSIFTGFIIACVTFISNKIKAKK